MSWLEGTDYSYTATMTVTTTDLGLCDRCQQQPALTIYFSVLQTSAKYCAWCLAQVQAEDRLVFAMEQAL